MLMLKTVVSVVGVFLACGIILWVVADLLGKLIMLLQFYGRSVGFVVSYLREDGMGCGYYERYNKRACELNVMFRTAISFLFYLVGYILLFLLLAIILPMASLPLHVYYAISYGCQAGWLIDGVFRVQYEKSVAPVIGRFDRIEESSESGEKLAIFIQPNGDEYRFDLEGWKKEEYPNEKCYHVVFCTENYWVFCPLGQ